MTAQNLQLLWLEILNHISLPVTKALFKQHGNLLDFQETEATVALLTSALIETNRSRIPHLQAAFWSVTNQLVEVKLVVESEYSSSHQEEISSWSLEKISKNPEHLSPVSLSDGEFSLTSDQERALSQLKNLTISQEKFFRLTGFAGTGKTVLITSFIQWLVSEGINFVAATPTNKSAKNLSQIAENSGLNLEVKTVAQLLGQQPVLDEETGIEVFLSKEELDWSGYGIIIIDEFSMLNRDNFKEIASEVKSSLLSKVVFVGDSAQLPPVGEREPIVSRSSEIQQSATLTQVVRYDGEMARVAQEIRSNPKYSRTLYPFTTTRDSTILCLPQKEWLQRAVALFDSPQFKLNPDHIRFLAWRNKTVESLNNFVRSQLWGKNAPDYVTGDRLIARRPLFRAKPGAKGKNKWRIAINNSEEAVVIDQGEECELLFLGQIYKYWKVMVKPDCGKEQPLSILHRESQKLYNEKVKYLAQVKQWQSYFDLSRMFDDVGYAYSLTTHKAQGSTIDYVFLDVADMRGCSERQKLQYTALTRAKTQVLIPSN
ncbi:Viral (Superfamily 1) RNA helicase (modular protein) [Hyella patelloides LEGE 07179]|uniref:Viral (Superfamily 1) RNA helicase (Modular protein) n=1 Tax=Hyella patelloides LEGE 07179 TaxID=945734 RepID=A0A563VZC9_9CYAN|nr:AAA family ATPase [Hyella patelloides]VEP16791.1 Viral (Superfamily 1) RNA helicase (modular protein) [Hyella patelloides LEGE 07179]